MPIFTITSISAMGDWKTGEVETMGIFLLKYRRCILNIVRFVASRLRRGIGVYNPLVDRGVGSGATIWSCSRGNHGHSLHKIERFWEEEREAFA